MNTRMRVVAAVLWQMTSVVIGLSGLNASAFAAPASTAQLALAKDGRALQPIVLSVQASSSTKAAVQELAEYLQRITGAPFEVKTGDGSSGIVVGTIKEFPNAALQKPLEIRDAFDGREAFAIRTEGKRVLLIGATDLAVGHAVSRFLEAIGYRHFFQAREWEVVPSLPVLQVNLNEDSRPKILSRRIWYGHGYFIDRGKDSRNSRSVLDYAAWNRHNRLGESVKFSIGHSWEGIINSNKAEFDAHPEYFALINGKRQGPMFCVSNDGLRRLVVKDRLNYLRANPNADMVSIEPADLPTDCQCEQCAKLGNTSDRFFGLANDVAKAVGAEFPDKFVGMLAYSRHSDPPTFGLEPNVAVMLTHGFNYGNLSFEELVQAWTKKCRHLGYYDYWSVWQSDYDMPPFLGEGYARKQIPFYAKNNAIALSAESSNNWGPRGLLYYTASKLMWNPEADVEALLQDFYDKAFGPAAAPMRRFYGRFDKERNPFISDNSLGLAYRDMEEASHLAQNRPDVMARLDDLKGYLRYIQLYLQWNTEKDPAKRKQTVIAMFTHVYRTRYSYMEHWRGTMVLAHRLAKEYNEPTWTLNNPASRPWENDKPYTREEIEAAFQAGLKEYSVVEIEEKKFSSDLVPVRFPDVAPGSGVAGVFASPGRYLLYSFKGEPLEVGIRTSAQAEGARLEPKAEYLLTSHDGLKIAEGTLRHREGGFQLRLPVPKPGLYLFDYQPNSFARRGGWSLTVAAGKPNTLDLAHQHERKDLRIVFYVPKGTRVVQLYTNPGVLSVRGANGKILGSSTTFGRLGRVLSIAVPAGEDGRLWSFPAIYGDLHFYNIPNYAAPSPQALMVPREVAEKDQLAIVQP